MMQRVYISLVLLLLLSACAMQPAASDAQAQTQLQTRLEGKQQNAFLRDYARVLSKSGKHNLAARILEDLRRENPADLSITRQIASVYERAGKLDLALLAWESIYQNTKDPLHDGAEYARVALMNQRYEMARTVYRKWMSRSNPGSSHYVTAINNIGYSYLLEQNIDKAKSWFEQAVKLDPLHRKARANLELLQQMQADVKRGGT